MLASTPGEVTPATRVATASAEAATTPAATTSAGAATTTTVATTPAEATTATPVTTATTTTPTPTPKARRKCRKETKLKNVLPCACSALQPVQERRKEDSGLSNPPSIFLEWRRGTFFRGLKRE